MTDTRDIVIEGLKNKKNTPKVQRISFNFAKPRGARHLKFLNGPVTDITDLKPPDGPNELKKESRL